MSQATGSHTTSRPQLRAVPSSLPKVQIAHLRLIAAIAVEKPHAIFGGAADVVDLTARAEHLDKLFGAFRSYLTEIMADTAENAPLGFIDKKYVEKIVTDLIGDVVGEVSNAADKLAEWES